MWRAVVIDRIEDGRVVVAIPSLYRDDPVGPMQSAVDAQIGDAVVVADLRPNAKVEDWWVLGYESQIGRWGAPYPHTHPVGQVTGVNATGDPITLVDILAGKADKSDVPAEQDLSGYATKTELSSYATKTELSTGYPTKTDLSNGLATKAAAPGAWTPCSVSTYLVADATSSPTLAVRNTPLGVQIRGRYRTVAAVPLDAVIFTLPAGFTPSHPILFSVPVMGPGSAYDALTWGMEFQTNGTVTARQNYLSGGRMSFNNILTF